MVLSVCLYDGKTDTDWPIGTSAGSWLQSATSEGETSMNQLPRVLNIFLKPRNLVHDTLLLIQMADRISIDLL